MRRLILFRHAKAVRPREGLSDFDRELMPRGIAEAARAGSLLADLGLAPDLALLSPSRRTVETWEAAAPVLSAGGVQLDPDLYDASADVLIARLSAHADVETLLLVGHNPGLHNAALDLVGAGPNDVRARASLAQGLPTACAVVFGIDGVPAAHAARLAAFVAPARDDDH